MEVKTPYGTVVFENDCPPERVQEILTRYAHKIKFIERRKGEKKDAA